MDDTRGNRPEMVTEPIHQCYNEEAVKSMSIEEMSDVFIYYSIDYEDLETEEEMRDLLVQEINKSQATTNKDKRNTINQEAEKSFILMEKILEKDAKVKGELDHIYKLLLDLLQLKNFDERLKSEVQAEFGDFLDQLRQYSDNLQTDECPIVVAGETGAGKSSLLNLLLGQEILPHSVLSSTSTICQIRNGTELTAKIFTKQGESISIKFDPSSNVKDQKKKTEEQKERLRKYVTERGDGEYKCVDIYWPLPMLRHNTMIVDTPGIGESVQMTDKLLQYLPKAVAFIYVINSANAGGVQSDRLLKIFERQKKWEQEGQMQEFDPSCTIFVCNKWDQVPTEEEKKVWSETAQKLKGAWPVRADCNIEEQMFKMCTLEERRRISSGLPYTDNYKRLLSGIQRLIPASLLAKIRRHANWLEVFLGRLHHRLIARINATKKNKEEKLKMRAEVQERIEKLRYNTDEVKTKLTRTAEQKCEDIAQKLHLYLNSETTKNKMFAWQEAEIPEGNDLEVIKYRAKKLIVDCINTEIVKWCQREDIAMVTNELFNLFKKECKLLEGNCQDLDRVIEGVMSPLQGYLEGDETSSDVMVSNKVFPIQEKLALVLSAPLWLPLVISAGVIALPVAVGIWVKEAVEEKKKLKHFKDNKMSQMMLWAEEVLQNFTKDFIFQVLKTDYLKSFCEQLEDVCENVIPKQIKADEQLMSNILADMRDSETIKKQYQPLEKHCRQITGELLILKMEHFDGYSIPRDKIQVGKFLGRGNFSDVKIADFVDNDGRMVSGAIKLMRSSLNRGDSYDQMTEVKHLKNLNHENIIKCFGVSFQKDEQGNKYLSILMEVCDETLENLLICPNHLDKSDPCGCHVNRKLPCCHHNSRDTKQFRESWDFFCSMTDGILRGLEFVHRIGYVHRDLKLSNVLVKNNMAKIADVGFAKEKTLLTGSVIGTPTHMAPEVLQAKLYDSSADIYSMSIALWEMWYAKKVFSEEFNSEVVSSFMNLHDHIVNGHRPDFTARYAPPISLQDMIKECWEDDPRNRPTAEQLIHKMAEINKDIIAVLS